MLQRGLDYAAATVIICAICAAMLVLAAEILSFSSPVADAAAALGAAVLLNSLRRRIRTRAKHRSRPEIQDSVRCHARRDLRTCIPPDSPLSRMSAGAAATGLLPGTRSHLGRIPVDRTLVTGARATRFGSGSLTRRLLRLAAPSLRSPHSAPGRAVRTIPGRASRAGLAR